MAAPAQVSNSTLPIHARSTRFLPIVLAWQLVIVAAVLLLMQRQLWGFIAAGIVILVAMLLSLPVNGRSLLSTMLLRSRFAARRRAVVADPDQPVELVPLAQWLPQLVLTQTRNAYGEEIGVVADGSSWSALLELAADNSLLADRGAEFDLTALGALTRQDDVVFADIQVVTLTVPGPCVAMLTPDSPAIQSYLEVVGKAATPPAVRRSWVALRLDPRLCLEAVARRGNGTAGVFATLRFGLHRAQALLKRQGVITQVLDPLGVAGVLGLTSGAGVEHATERSQESWKQWTCDGLVHETRTVRSFGSAPTQNYQALLDSAAQSPAIMVLSSFTISPGEPARGAVRLITHNQEQSDAADVKLIEDLSDRIKFGPLGGTQVPGMLATIPLGRQVHT